MVFLDDPTTQIHRQEPFPHMVYGHPPLPTGLPEMICSTIDALSPHLYSTVDSRMDSACYGSAMGTSRAPVTLSVVVRSQTVHASSLFLDREGLTQHEHYMALWEGTALGPLDYLR